MMRRVNRPPLRRHHWLRRATLAAAAPLGGLLVVLAAAPPALAQEPEIETDARMEGFQGDVKVDNDSTALAWLFFVFLAVIGLSPLFKDAKRTPLD